jgi:hypothetical protein
MRTCFVHKRKGRLRLVQTAREAELKIGVASYNNKNLFELKVIKLHLQL